MTSTVTMSAPAGVPCRSGADLRPYAGVAVRRPAVAPRATVQGTGLPVARLRDVVTGTPRGEFTAQDQFQNDGTTLGFHPSSRPQS